MFRAGRTPGAPARPKPAVFGFGKKGPAEAQAPAAGPERSVATKVLPKFLAAVGQRPSPVVLDLGPVVGTNVSFLGERLGCKFLVEDLYADLERAVREDRRADLPAALATRFTQADASVDGILCWDFFDYLDKASAVALGAQLARVLAPGGVLAAVFSTKPAPEPEFTRFVVQDEHTLVHKPYRGVPRRGTAWQNRDVTLLLPGLRVVESFLLLTQTREILLRKPA